MLGHQTLLNHLDTWWSRWETPSSPEQLSVSLPFLHSLYIFTHCLHQVITNSQIWSLISNWEANLSTTISSTSQGVAHLCLIQRNVGTSQPVDKLSHSTECHHKRTEPAFPASKSFAPNLSKVWVSSAPAIQLPTYLTFASQHSRSFHQVTDERGFKRHSGILSPQFVALVAHGSPCGGARDCWGAPHAEIGLGARYTPIIQTIRSGSLW